MAQNIEQIILFQIDKTSKMSKNYSQNEFDKLGLDITVDQWILLKIVHENKGLSQKDLAILSHRDPASITRTIDLLEEKCLVVRKPIDGNRRRYSLDLSNEGEVFIHTNMPLINKHRKNSIKGLSNKEIEQLNTLLKKIQENLS
jgi:DNA-binding MarR family transcriptional regulator